MSTAYRPEVDGLRAVAVLPVIAFHAGFPGFSGGYVGVDIFFVISGYLITGILLGDLEEGRYSIARFYERRARRILPALFVVLAVTSALALALLLPPAFEDYAASVFGVALFVSNLLFIAEVDYFAPSAEETPLLHTWSLAVEEQFYILFPLILWLLWKLGRRHAVVPGVALLFVGSFWVSEWAWRAYPAQTFYFLPSRAWELLAGSAIALAPLRAPVRPGLLRQALGLAGLAMIAAAITLYDRTVPFPSYWAALPVGGAVLVIVFATPGTVAARFLSAHAVVMIGLISYSAYLWHNPLFALARVTSEGEPGPLAMTLLSILSLGLAWLTWRFVEGPFRFQRDAQPWLPRQGQVFAASAAGIVLFAGFGIWGYATNGRASLWLALTDAQSRQTYSLMRVAQDVPRMLNDGGCRFNINAPDADTRARLDVCMAQYGPGLAVIGDSHAIDLADALIRAQSAPFIFGLTRGSCRLDADTSGCGFDWFLALVQDNPALFSRVVFEVAGQHLIEGPGGREAERIFALYAPGTPMPAGDITLATDRIEANAAYVRALAAVVPTLWLSPRPEMHLDAAHIMAHGCDHDFSPRPGQMAIFERLAVAVAERAGAAQVIDQPAALALRFPEDFMTCEALDWSDGDHLSLTGRSWLAERIGPRLGL